MTHILTISKSIFQSLPITNQNSNWIEGPITTRAHTIPLIWPNIKEKGWETTKVQTIINLAVAVARGCSSNFRCLIIHPGGNAPDFGLSLKSDGFKVGPPCQGVDNKIAAIACFLCTKICICCNSLCNICATKAKTCFMYFLLFCRKCLIKW